MLVKVVASGAIMAAAVAPLPWFFSARVAVPVGIITGAIVYLLMLRRLALLSHEDESRVFQAWPAATKLRPLVSLVSALLGTRDRNSILAKDNSACVVATARHSS